VCIKSKKNSLLVYAIFLIFFLFLLFKPNEIVFAATPTPSPPSVSDSPDPQAGGGTVTFSCSSCSAGATGELMKLLICKSSSAVCALGSQWGYRKSIIITNSGSSALTDYQVNVTLDTASLISAGKMRSDCGDIRFTDSDGSTLLNYWLESGCNSASTKIWVKVPSIPASSTKTIYVYYGNPSATSASNYDNVFISPSDQFNRPDSPSVGNGWVDYDFGAANVSIENNNQKTNNTGYGAGGGMDKAYSSKSIPINDNFSITGWIKLSKEDYYTMNYGIYYVYGGTVEVYIDVMNYDGGYYNTITLGGSKVTRSTASVDSNVNYHKYELRVYGGYAYFYYDDVLKLSSALSSPLSSGAEIRILNDIAGDTSAGSARVGYALIDEIRVRKYTSPEPTTSVGTEETLTASNYIYTQSSAVPSNPSASYTCPSCTYSSNTYYGLSFNINQSVWTSLTSALTFTCKKENLCSCSAGECFNDCKADPDGVGAWCCNNDQCSHDGSCYTLVELPSTGSSSACILGENIVHNTQGSTNYRYAVYDGQLYYCGTTNEDKSPYAAVTNLIPRDKIGVCQCNFDGTWNCGGIIKVKGGKIKIVS
jgi:hypothetical protein